jgi:hypothetical protein
MTAIPSLACSAATTARAAQLVPVRAHRTPSLARSSSISTISAVIAAGVHPSPTAPCATPTVQGGSAHRCRPRSRLAGRVSWDLSALGWSSSVTHSVGGRVGRRDLIGTCSRQVPRHCSVRPSRPDRPSGTKGRHAQHEAGGHGPTTLYAPTSLPSQAQLLLARPPLSTAAPDRSEPPDTALDIYRNVPGAQLEPSLGWGPKG